MVDLLVDCLDLLLFFINVGVDVFGFWFIIICKIWGGSVNLKCWGILFICLVIRVVYIEVVEEMSLFVFINVVRRFIVIWGLVKIFCFD